MHFICSVTHGRPHSDFHQVSACLYLVRRVYPVLQSILTRGHTPTSIKSGAACLNCTFTPPRPSMLMLLRQPLARVAEPPRDLSQSFHVLFGPRPPFNPGRNQSKADCNRSSSAAPGRRGEEESLRPRGGIGLDGRFSGRQVPLMGKMLFGRLRPLTRLPSRGTSFSPRRLFILAAPPVMGRTLTGALARAKVPPRQHNPFDLRRPLPSFISIFKTFPFFFFFAR